MEFYIKPEQRLKGYGKSMCERLETLFEADGAENVYLTADPVTGEPFWTAIGYTNTHERSPENGQYFFEKKII